MLGESHAILGLSTTAALLITNGTNLIEHPVLFSVSVLVGTLAALLPDIDSPNATIRLTFGVGREQSRQALKNWRRKGFFSRVLDLVLWMVARVLDVIDWLLPHRGPTHWGITWVGLSLLMYGACYLFGWPEQIAFAFTVGYFSHLVGDGVTKSGVRLFAPFWPKSVRFLPRGLAIRTGSWGELVMLVVLLAVVGVYFLVVLYAVVYL